MESIGEIDLTTKLLHPSILIIDGNRKYDKTRDFSVYEKLLTEFNDIPLSVIITQCQQIRSIFKNISKNTFFYDHYDSNIFNKIIERQNLIQVKAKTNNNIDTRLFLYIDNIINDTDMCAFIYCHRNLNVTCVFHECENIDVWKVYYLNYIIVLKYHYNDIQLHKCYDNYFKYCGMSYHTFYKNYIELIENNKFKFILCDDYKYLRYIH